ncbi:MAG: zinc ABC transporter substrate-binding protein [Acetobacteraceae bacterium]|nr:zinc ABC transporter substrate-binding protein [Acetobacteraceae bacterium]
MTLRLTRRAVLPLGAALLAAPAMHAQTRPVVVASFSILGDMVRQIAGDQVALRVLAGPGVDAHVFQPRPSEAEAIRGAALVVRNGFGFEPWLDRLLRSTGYRGPVATATQGITPRIEAGDRHGHGKGAPDPHCWQDVRLAQSYARTIGEGLAEADPGRAAEWRKAAADYATRLAGLDAWVRERIATVPPERRLVITTHDAFAYFGAAYGVRFLAPQGIAPEGQPSAARVAALIRQIREAKASAVFIEGIGNQAVMERLAQDAGVSIRGRLFADTLSPPDGPAPTYEAMMRHNIDAMVPAMRGG